MVQDTFLYYLTFIFKVKVLEFFMFCKYLEYASIMQVDICYQMA